MAQVRRKATAAAAAETAVTTAAAATAAAATETAASKSAGTVRFDVLPQSSGTGDPAVVVAATMVPLPSRNINTEIRVTQAWLNLINFVAKQLPHGTLAVSIANGQPTELIVDKAVVTRRRVRFDKGLASGESKFDPLIC